MKDRREEGLWAWRQKENNNRMIAFQERELSVATEGAIELAYFGGSAFRITSPAGLTIMIDPWRNPPWGNWDWYLQDFPAIEVDIGISTHAHFDHDGLHFLKANTLLDRPVGTFEFADVRITGIADKHVSDSSHNAYDWAALTRRLTDMETNPPNNWRSFDNCLVLVEVAGLRILHWGDNRPNPPENVWNRIADIDIALLPADGSFHVLSAGQLQHIAQRLRAKVIVPHHYAIWNVTTRASTLLPPDQWVNQHKRTQWFDQGAVKLDRDYVKAQEGLVMCFGEHVAFSVENPKATGGVAE
jgi:L-ascorbate metabolism protein UlaG (beta-lactamase superfamily)